MVKRYPHTAIVTADINGKVVKGEWEEGSKSTHEVIGRFDPVDTNNIIRINSQGHEVIIKGEFYTQQKRIDGMETITIAELGIVDKEIVCWWDYQTHSIISI